MVHRRLAGAGLQPHRRGQRDHRAVVGAQRQLGIVHPPATLQRSCIQLATQFGVRSHAAGDHQPPQAGGLQRGDGLLHQHFDDGRLRAGGQIGQLRGRGRRAQLAVLGEHRRLQPGERKIQVAAVQQRPWQRKGIGPAAGGQPGQRRPARIAQAHQLGALVERLAGSIVDALAQQGVLAHRVHPHQLGVATRHQQRDERKLWWVGRQKG